MYYDHFGLTEPPFRITPDTRWFFTGGNRGAILDALAFAITNGEGIVKVVGEVGSGKTMLCRMLEVRLPAGVEVVYLANPNLSPDNILHAIAFELDLGLAEDASRLQVMQVLQRYLLERHGAGSQVVVFVEEAQSMPIETLEEIRLLSNLETQRHKLLQLVLFGQPELEPNLSAPHIRQLRERITHSFELPAFSRDEIGQYLDFRMRAAGYRGPAVFTPAAVRAIARASEGLIRRINILADKSLLAAYAAGTHQVTPRLVKVAVADSEFGRRARWRRPLAWVSITTGLAVLATAGYLWLTRPQWPDAPAAAAPAAPSASRQAAPAANREAPPREAAGAPQPAPPQPQPGGAPVREYSPRQAEKTPSAAPEQIQGQQIQGQQTQGQQTQGQQIQGQQTQGQQTQGQAKKAPGGGVRPGMDIAPVPPRQAAREPERPAATRPAAVAVAPTPLPQVADAPSAVATPPRAAATSAPRAQEAPVRPHAYTDAATSAPRAPETPVRPHAYTDAATSAPRAQDAPPPPAAPSDPAGEEPRPAAPPALVPGEMVTTPAVAAGDPYLEARLAATRDWLEEADPAHFSIQLMLVSSRRAAELDRRLRDAGLGHRLEDIYVYRALVNGADVVGVLLGDYARYAAARADLEDLPRSMKTAQPFIRNVRDIRAGRVRRIEPG
ncbi:MAG: AAA family ATPase [Gammaproteobacteria bacterium]|nr:AAA family ATPase [Gammaproteobacteria bacterium]